jgi:hypothetical protein
MTACSLKKASVNRCEMRSASTSKRTVGRKAGGQWHDANKNPWSCPGTLWGWLDTANADTRKANPHYYWGRRFADAPTRYYWDEQSVSREEYATNMGDDVPLMSDDYYQL